MPNMLQQNLNFFKEFFPGVYNQLKATQSIDSYQVYEAKTAGLFYLLCQQEQREIPLHSKYNPVQEAETWAGSQDLTGKRHVVLFGLGLGYHLEALQRKYPNLNFYVYEPDLGIFSRTLECKDWRKFDWIRIKHIIFEDGSGKYRQFIASILDFMKEDWVFLTLPAFERCFEQNFSALKESLKQQKENYLRSLNTNIVFEKEWTVNALKNLPLQLKYTPVFAYQDFFKGKTVVMTASGPSLNQAIPSLKHIKEKQKALIIAAGSSINALMKYDLEPDLFVSYDPFEGNYIDLKRYLGRGVPLVFGSTINNDVIKHHLGPKTFFISSQDSIYNNVVGALDPQTIVSDAPSIAVITLQLLVKLGVEKVVLVGQDLAFYNDTRYAEGISVYIPEKVEEAEKENYIEVEANNGEQVYTSSAFNLMRKSLEIVIADAPFTEIINTSLHGAKIAGAKYRELEQVVLALPDRSATKRLNFDRKQNAIGLRKIKKRVKTILKEFEAALDKISVAIERFLKSYEQGNMDKTELLYENISQSLSKLSSSQEFIAFIYPMVRNEDHLIRRKSIDIPGMTMVQRRDFINKELSLYLEGVHLSILKLNEVLEEWDLQAIQEV